MSAPERGVSLTLWTPLDPVFLIRSGHDVDGESHTLTAYEKGRVGPATPRRVSLPQNKHFGAVLAIQIGFSHVVPEGLTKGLTRTPRRGVYAQWVTTRDEANAAV
jgi:hypothetical protein